MHIVPFCFSTVWFFCTTSVQLKNRVYNIYLLLHSMNFFKITIHKINIFNVISNAISRLFYSLFFRLSNFSLITNRNTRYETFKFFIELCSKFFTLHILLLCNYTNFFSKVWMTVALSWNHVISKIVSFILIFNIYFNLFYLLKKIIFIYKLNEHSW